MYKSQLKTIHPCDHFVVHGHICVFFHGTILLILKDHNFISKLSLFCHELAGYKWISQNFDQVINIFKPFPRILDPVEMVPQES